MGLAGWLVRVGRFCCGGIAARNVEMTDLRTCAGFAASTRNGRCGHGNGSV
jgi:hypothetical protein